MLVAEQHVGFCRVDDQKKEDERTAHSRFVTDPGTSTQQRPGVTLAFVHEAGVLVPK
jgi:hypothetical protein